MWKATKKSKSLLWIHLTAVLASDGKFSRVCSQEDAVSQPRLAQESIAVAGQSVQAWEPAETSCCSNVSFPHFLAPLPDAALQAGLLCCCSMSKKGKENQCILHRVHCSLLPHMFRPHCKCTGSVHGFSPPTQTHHSCGHVATAPAKRAWTATGGSTPKPHSSPEKPSSFCGCPSSAQTYQNQLDWMEGFSTTTTFFLFWSYLCHRLNSLPGGRMLWPWLMLTSHGPMNWLSLSQPDRFHTRHVLGSPILTQEG